MAHGEPRDTLVACGGVHMAPAVALAEARGGTAVTAGGSRWLRTAPAALLMRAHGTAVNPGGCQTASGTGVTPGGLRWGAHGTAVTPGGSRLDAVTAVGYVRHRGHSR